MGVAVSVAELGTAAAGSRVLGIRVRVLVVRGGACLVGWVVADRLLGSIGAMGLEVAVLAILAVSSWFGVRLDAELLVALRSTVARFRPRAAGLEARPAGVRGGLGGRVVVAGLVRRAHLGVLGREDAALDRGWSELLRTAAASCRRGERLLVRQTVVPTVELDATGGARGAWLAERSWSVETHVGLASVPRPRRSRAGGLRRALEAAARASGDVVRIEELEDPRSLVSSVLPPTARPLRIRRERAGLLELEAGVVRVLRARAFPAGPTSSAQLTPLFAVEPPRRVVALVAEPIDALQASRRLGRAHVEVAADQSMRARHGYRVRPQDAAVPDRLVATELDLAEGHRLCRWELLVAVVAPNHRELELATGAVRDAAARARIELEVVPGRQRAALELALLGVEGWS